MGDFNRGRFGGNRSFGKRGFGDRQNSRPQMHDAICSSCGKECQVPFRPTGEKPVYCRDCFAKMNGGDSRQSFGRNDRNERPAFHTSNQDRGNQSLGDEQLKDINRKLDKILAFLAPKTEKTADDASASAASAKQVPSGVLVPSREKAQEAAAPSEIEAPVAVQNEDDDSANLVPSREKSAPKAKRSSKK